MTEKLFVGGISFSTTSEQLRELFAGVGDVASAAVVTDRDTGQPRGFAFVEMATAEQANEAVKRLTGYQLDGRVLKVEIANRSGVRDVAGRGGAQRGGRW